MPSDGSASPPPPRPARRHRILLVTAAALGLVFLLAISIADVQLLPGEPFLLRMNPLPTGMPVPGMPGAELIVVFVRILLALSIILFPFYLIVSILTREGRRRLLMNILTIIALMIALAALRNLTANLNLEMPGSENLVQPPTGQETPPPDAEFDVIPPDWTVTAVTLAVSLLIVGLGAAVIAFAVAKRKPPSPMQQLAVEAQQAIDELQAGGGLEETIMRCYRDMCKVVQDRRGLQRDAAMTPGEFEQALRAGGLPREAVHQLTHLFEEVRYGAKQAGERERRQAIDSLSAIVAACGGQA